MTSLPLSFGGLREVFEVFRVNAPVERALLYLSIRILLAPQQKYAIVMRRPRLMWFRRAVVSQGVVSILIDALRHVSAPHFFVREIVLLQGMHFLRIFEVVSLWEEPCLCC